MRVEALVSFADQFAVKPLLAAARFVARYEQDGSSFRVESESHAPNPVRGIKRSSFIFACPESLSVSTRGRPIFGPSCWSERVKAGISSWTFFFQGQA